MAATSSLALDMWEEVREVRPAEPAVQTPGAMRWQSHSHLRLCYSAPARPSSGYHSEGNLKGAERPAHMRSREDITQAVQRHADTVLRVCAIYLRERADREDAFQDTFLRYAHHDKPFNDDEHRKAWLIRVAANICKDQLKRASSKVEGLDELAEERLVSPDDDGQEAQRNLERTDLVAALRTLDEKYRTVLYLKYYEDYTAAQIAELLGVPENTVYTNLARGRRALRGVLSHGA